jgi:cytochrome P450
MGVAAAPPERPSARFDIYSPELCGSPYWSALRELRGLGQLVWVESVGGFWAALSYDLVRRLAQDWEMFSSAQGVSIPRPGPDVQPYIMPIEKDPPRQLVFRREVNPHLTPAALAGLEESIRDIADELIDMFIEQGSCDLTIDFARKLPGTVFFRLVIPEGRETLGLLEHWTRMLSFDPDVKRKGEAASHIRDWATGVLDRHSSRAPEATGDIVDAIIGLRENPTGFTETELNTGVGLLAQGGIGTSAQLIGSTVKVLCERPHLQARVRDDLRLVPNLVEEVLRTEPPVTVMFRTATRDVEIAGQKIAQGDKVGLFFAAANRDPDVFDRPDEVDIDRQANPHVAFGLGAHRCAGSNLARLQVRVAMEELLTRLSPFRIPAGATVEYVTASQRGPSSIPLEFAAGPRRFAEAEVQGR